MLGISHLNDVDVLQCQHNRGLLQKLATCRKGSCSLDCLDSQNRRNGAIRLVMTKIYACELYRVKTLELLENNIVPRQTCPRPRRLFELNLSRERLNPLNCCSRSSVLYVVRLSAKGSASDVLKVTKAFWMPCMIAMACSHNEKRSH